MTQLDPNVAKLSPSLYSAAYYANLTGSEANVVNQLAGTVALNKELSGMPTEKAYTRWKQLDPHAQEQIKAMYGDASYIPKERDSIAWRIGKGAATAVLGPFKAVFEVAGVYNNVINAPYLFYRQVKQGASVFDWDVYKGAWDGTNVFDNKSLASLHQEYGDTDTFVAMKTLQGMKPGEILDAYGQVNSDIIRSLTTMLTEPDRFQGMMNQFKGAQVSPGRDIARVMFNANPIDNKLYGSQKWNKTSGTIDAVYQIVVDPLTWITGGSSKLVTKADKLADALARGEKSVAEVFARKEIRDTWDNVAGRLVRNYAEAGDRKARVLARNEIARQMPDLNNDAMINLLATNKVFDAESAQNFFSKSEPMLELLAGRVDGTTFFRTGIPIAKRSRTVTAGLNKKIGDFINGSVEDAKLSDNMLEDLHKIGVEADPIYASQTPLLEGISKELQSTKRKLGRLAARFPATAEINITDEGVHRTISTVKSLARTIYPKAHAEFFAEAFLDSNAYDRVILLRGLYTQVMHNMGLHATENGQNLMRQILQEKFADTTSFLSRKDLAVPPQHASFLESRGLLESQPAQGMGGLLKTSYAGPVNFYNGKPTIGNLPWSAKAGEVSLADYAFNFTKNQTARKVVDAVGGATRNQWLRRAVNGWTVATLFPRLGIRSALDEAFMYSMMAPGEDLFKLGLGRKLHKSIIAFGGSEEGIPPIKRAILNWLDKNPAKAVGIEDRFVKTTINGEERLRLETRENIANKVVEFFDQTIPEHLHDKMYQAMVHNPEIASAMVNSIIGKSGINAGLDGGDLASTIISNSHLTNLWKELGFKPTGKYKEWDVEDLAKVNEAAVSAAHYQNWFMRFTRNAANFVGGNENFIHAGEAFIRHNALRTGEDFVQARNYILERVGVNVDNMTVANESALKKYLELSQQTARDAMDGWSGVDTAVKRVETMLLDMYNTFHGSAVAFNDRLYGHIRETADFLQTTEKMGVQKSIREALNTVDGKVFEELTRGFRPEGKINTDIGFSKVDTNEGMWQQMVAWADHAGFDNPMEWMDAQNNHLFRQPALWATYAKLRERYDFVEKQFVEELVSSGMSRELSIELAEKKFTETAMSNAANYILKASDNPQIRSNLAWTLRTTGRFYRATEDFYRRVFRLKDVAPQILYRMRLAHLGLQSNGFIHPDQNGDPYLVMPADNILFQVFNGAGAFLSGNPDAIKQPMFNEFAVKLAMGNPSFQQDAGQPSLSGPMVAVPILLAQSVLKGWGGDLGAQVAKDLDNAVLGNVNQNLDWTKALVPSSFQRVWSMLPKDEKDQQTASAMMQAIAYNAAHGIILTPEKYAKLPPEERARASKEYRDNLKVTANNVLFMRGLLGLISPIAPTVQESQDVPAYLKNAGINGLRAEFADILQGVMRNSKGRIQDPYEAALMTFTGKYPGRLVYTIARDERQTQVLVNKTKETQKWMLTNGKNMSTYGDAAFIFAPHIGEYNPDVYLWMQAAGLMEQRKLGDYFDEVMVAQDRQKYFDYKDQAEALFTNPNLNTYQRQQVLDQLRGAQKMLKDANPLLEQALNSKSYGIGKQQAMAESLAGILSDPNFKMPDATRKKMQVAYKIFQNGLDAIRNDITDDVVNGGMAKQEIKLRVLDAIRELGGSTDRNAPQDPVIAEAMRSIFQPILDFYVRNNMRAGS